MKEQIIDLLKQGRKLEAVATAHRLGGGTLQQAKRYVDAVERETMNGNLPDDNDRVVRTMVASPFPLPYATSMANDNLLKAR